MSRLRGADELAAEVVDDEAAAEGLDVERRLVEVAGGVVAEVEHFEGKFAAGDDEGPAAGNPAGIDFGGADEGDFAFVAGLGGHRPGRERWGRR